MLSGVSRGKLAEKGNSMAKTSKDKSGVSNQGGRPPKFATPELLQAAIDDYFESCWMDKITENTDAAGNCTMSTVRYQNRPYTIMGLAMHLNLSRQGLCEYAEKGQFSDIVKRAKQKVEMFVEEQLLWSKSATGAIFWLKNHADYTDKVSQEFSGSTDLNIKVSYVKPNAD